MSVVKVVDALDSDPAGEPLAYDPGPSDLALLAADVTAEVAEPTRLRHPGRPNYTLIFRSHVESAEAQSCQKRTQKAKDPIRAQNALFLAITNTGIEKDGVAVENSAGAAVTFRDPELLEAMAVKTAADCVVKFLAGNDGHILALADAVMRAAGFGTEVEVAADPIESA